MCASGLCLALARILVPSHPTSARKPSWTGRAGIDMDRIGGVASFRHPKEETRTYYRDLGQASDFVCKTLLAFDIHP